MRNVSDRMSNWTISGVAREVKAIARSLVPRPLEVSVPKDQQPHIVYIPFSPPPPPRRVVLAWRRTFTRYEAIAALRNAIYACELPGVKRLTA